MGDYRRPTNVSHVSLGFVPINPKSFTKLEVLNQKFNATSMTHKSSNEVVFLLYANCGEEPFVGDCAEEELKEEVQAVTMNSNRRATQTETEFKISSLKQTLAQFMLTTQNKFLNINMLQSSLSEKHEESMTILEVKMSMLFPANHIISIGNGGL